MLTRVLGIDADLAVARNERMLWTHAQALLPSVDIDFAMPRYTQGLMDLGASLCTPRNPACSQCPLQTLCVAHREGAPEHYPVRTRKLKRRAESWWLLVLKDSVGRFWLSRRPAAGIWAGLYCVPVFSSRHRDLHLHPVVVGQAVELKPDDGGGWFTAEQIAALGLPAPVRKLLAGL